MARTGNTPPFTDGSGRIVPGSIAEVRFAAIGGIDQWILIRGRSMENPPLILLHGGPGFSETCFFRRYLAPLEDYFTLIYWDQRGCGKSFTNPVPRSDLWEAQE